MYVIYVRFKNIHNWVKRKTRESNMESFSISSKKVRWLQVTLRTHIPAASITFNDYDTLIAEVKQLE